MPTVNLKPHPQTPDSPVEGIEVQVERDGVVLWLRFVAGGDVDVVAWPAPRPQGRADELWKHTCFEAFVGTAGGYVEFNLSPSGEWASYRFDGYRDSMERAEEVATVSGIDGGDDYVALEANIELPNNATGPIALSAIVEDLSGEKTYWALAHPAGKPDFHHPDSFVLELPA